MAFSNNNICPKRSIMKNVWEKTSPDETRLRKKKPWIFECCLVWCDKVWCGIVSVHISHDSISVVGFLRIMHYLRRIAVFYRGCCCRCRCRRSSAYTTHWSSREWSSSASKSNSVSRESFCVAKSTGAGRFFRRFRSVTMSTWGLFRSTWYSNLAFSTSLSIDLSLLWYMWSFSMYLRFSSTSSVQFSQAKERATT